MTKILLLTADFPFSSGEVFIENEMLAFSRMENLSMDILPTRIYHSSPSDKPTRTLPDNVRLREDVRSGISGVRYAAYMAAALFSRPFWGEMKALRRKGRLSRSAFFKSLAFAARGEYVYRRLKKLYAKEIKAGELIVYSYWMTFPSYAAARLAERCGVPAVSRAHGGDLYNERTALGFQPMRGYTLEHLSAAYPCSELGAAYLRERYPAAEKSIACARLGTNDHGERQLSAPFSERKELVIASCSSVIPLKRVWLIAEALKSAGDCPIRWYHFGGGEEKELARLREVCAGLPQNVTFVEMGGVKNSELMDFYRDNDVHLFINASTLEGVPVSIMEAISFGIPSIAVDAGASGEVVRPAHGVLLDSLPEAELTAALSAAISRFAGMDDAEYATMRKAAREYWTERYNSQTNYTAFYNKLIDSSGGHR